ncbi:hypothetical protein [uncultured Paraglaciecola sp.]|uniref:hypothetical protein n=1 Tax=uncultured Paraglaciecola sp. TaxID=1765024 RepID=UPI00261DE556|nr:hypothetical protein [uncultured Paraglaciecola sp.]
MNQIEETICNVCGDNNECDRAEEAKREYEADEKQKEKREAINLKRRETYWKPENIQKRRLAKIQRNKERFERNRKIIEETFNIVNSMFR